MSRTTLLNKGGTTIYLHHKDGVVKASGEGVGGQQPLTMSVLAKMFGAKSVKDNMNESKFNEARFDKKNAASDGDFKNFTDKEGDAVFKIGGAGVAGHFKADFAAEEQREAFEDFLIANPDIFKIAMGGDVPVDMLLADAEVSDNLASVHASSEEFSKGVKQFENSPEQVKVGGEGFQGNALVTLESEALADKLVEALQTEDGQADFIELYA